MQKKLMYIVFLLLTVCSKAAAQDLMTVSSFSLGAGYTREVGVQLTNADTYVGFQFDLYLPQGFTVESFTAGSRLPSGTTPQMAQQADGSYRFVAAALSGNAISGNSGTVLTLTVKAAATATAGSYDGYLRNVKISLGNGYGVTIAEQSFTITVVENEPYAVLDGTTLTFYYDKRKEERGGMSVGPREWDNVANTITTVVFDSSFANCTTLTSTAYWFNQCSNLTTIQGIANLNTANVTNMRLMFYSCSGLTSLDVSGFNTANVTDMSLMFSGCTSLTSLDLSGFNTGNVTVMSLMFANSPNLTTIYVGDGWSTAAVTDEGYNMFLGTPLVGGAFTTFDADHVDATYAHIDGGTQNPGYLTSIADKAEVAAVIFSRSLYELTMSCATENVRIMYAVITDPTAEPQYEQYTAPVTLTADCTVRAYAVRPSGIQSAYSEYTFSMSDVQTVEMPTMSWSGDEMTLATVTADATIHYILDAEGTVPQEQVYTAPVTVTSNVTISTWATKDEMQNSDTLTIVYPYTAWAALVETVSGAQLLAREAATNDNVPAQMLTELQNQIDIAVMAYEVRTATEPEIVERRAALEAIMAEVRERINAVAEPYAVLSDNNTLLTFYYDKKKEERGGMSVGMTAGNVIGALDNSSDFWAEHSDNVKVEPGKTVITSFVNYTNGANNWENFVVVLCAADNTEYAVVRADNYGWGTGYENNASLQTSTEENRNWDSWLSDMNGAKVTVFVTNNGDGTADVRCVMRSERTVIEYTQDYIGINQINADDLYCRLTVDKCHLELSNGDWQPWYHNRASITNARFDDSFANAAVTSTAYWFKDCYSLAAVDGMNNLNTANVTDMYRMFQYCYALSSLDVSGFNTANVTNMGCMFELCSSLTSLDVSGFNTANVTSMTYMFRGCSGLTSLDLSSFNTANVTNMAAMFTDCSGLTSLDLSNFNTANVTGMYGMFYGCSSLTTIYVGADWSTAAVTYDTSPMFRGCTALVGGAFTAYDADHYNETYAHIDGGTQNPGYLTSIADKTEVAAVTFSRSLFELTMSCATENVHIMYAVVTDPTAAPQWQQYTAPVTLTADCTVRAYAVRPSGIQSAYAEYTFRMSDVQRVESPTLSWSGDELTLATVTAGAAIHYILDAEGTVPQEQVYTAPVTVTSNVTITTWATKDEMQNSDTLSIVYPYTAWAALVETLSDAQLVARQAATSDNVPAQMLNELKNQIDIAEALYQTRTATEPEIVDIRIALEAIMVEVSERVNAVAEPYAVLDGTTLTFYYDKKKEERGGMDINNVYINEGSDSPYGIAAKAVIDATFANFRPVSTAYWFIRCYNLTAIEGIGNLKTDSVTDMNSMFDLCTGLTSLDLSGFNTANVTDMGRMFYGCSGLKTIYVGADWSTASVTQGAGMFYGCTALVGGQGTTFDPGHVDAGYAHIDGGTQNPGYLTDINLGPYQGTVAAPTFSWQGDELTITTATADAELFYQLSDTDVDGDGTVTDADYVLYTAPVEIRRNVTVKAYGAKQGLVNSDVTTLVYPYEAWERLMNTIKYAEEVVAQCQGSTKVTQQELDELALEARRASGLYNERTMTETEILDYANALEAAAADIWARHNSTDGDYSFDTTTGVLTLQNGMTVTEAVNTLGGDVAESVTAILWQNTTALTATDLAVVSNPNLLIYVTDAALAPAGRDNVVANGVADNVVLTSQGTGNIDFYCPQAFTARRISYTREFVQQTTIGVSRGWESIALPFTVQRVEHQTQGAIVPFGSTEPGYRFWLRQLTANGLQGAQTIEANVGYLISMPNSSEYTEGNLGGVVTFSAENAEVPVTRPVVSESAQHALLPSFRRMAAQQGVYVLNVSAPRNGYAEGSIFEENYRELLPFQAYTEHLGTQPAPPYFVIGKMGGDGTTGIADVRADVEDTDYYDLNGRRLQGKPRQKGVYIRQGRKVIVR